jgi:hypothetical protein
MRHSNRTVEGQEVVLAEKVVGPDNVAPFVGEVIEIEQAAKHGSQLDNTKAST